MELFLNISNLALILKAKFKKLFFEEISYKIFEKKISNLALILKANFFN
jgi:hypothetical protein